MPSTLEQSSILPRLNVAIGEQLDAVQIHALDKPPHVGLFVGLAKRLHSTRS